MKKYILVAILFFGFGLTPTFACSGSCSVDADCAANPCRYCNTDFGVCADCCEYTEPSTCPSACSWSGSECQNIGAVSCGVTIPETPGSLRSWLYIAIFITLVGGAILGGVLKRRRRA